jgi:hypothetical protein
MIGEWEVPRIERVGTVEERRLARLSVPGLAGDLHHDLGSQSLAVEIAGSLHGDTERDDFLENVRAPFNAGEPLAFVADILTATELEQVLIVGLELEEANESGDSFRYVIRLRQYVEPPEPPPPIDDLGAELGPELDLLADLGLDGLELPGLVGDIPSLGDPTPPLKEALDGVKSAVTPLNDALSSLGEAFA